MKDSSETYVQSDWELYERWVCMVPRDKMDVLFLVAGFEDFQKNLASAFQLGAGDQYLQDVVKRNSYQHVYVSQSPTGKEEKEIDEQIIHNFQKDFWSLLQPQLEEFKCFILESKFDSIIKNAYLTKIREVYRLGKLGKYLATPMFTLNQQPISTWRRIIDLPATVSNQTLILHYESLANFFLAATLNLEYKKKNIYDVVQYYSLSVRELEKIGLHNGVTELPADQGRDFIALLLKHVGLHDWDAVLQSNLSAITVNSKLKQILCPKDRIFSIDDLIYICTHEFVHVARGHNGYLQKLRLVSEGFGDYMFTEEGVATVSELLAGLPWNHPRRRLIVARYLAVAMAVKVTRTKTGKVKALYTWQEIYSTLVNYGIEPLTASKILWRIMRGTSLSRRIIELDLGKTRIPVAECFVKDVAYFQGQLEVVHWLSENMNLVSSNKLELSPSLSVSNSFESELLVFDLVLQAPEVVELFNSLLVGKMDMDYLCQIGISNSYWNRDVSNGYLRLSFSRY